MSRIKSFRDINGKRAENMAIGPRQNIEMSWNISSTQIEVWIVGFEVIVFSNRDIERLFSVHVEIPKTDGFATIPIGIPAIIERD